MAVLCHYLVSLYIRPLKNILEIRSVSPLVFAGSLQQVPVHNLVVNGGWIMPDRILFDFVSEARESPCLPVVIAKKIHGILVPALQVIGDHRYEYVSDIRFGKRYWECAKLQQRFRNPKRGNSLLKSITYNERLEDPQELSRDISDEYYEGNVLKRFLEEILTREAAEVYSRGLDQRINFDGNFQDVAIRLKDEKLKVRLCQWIEKRSALFAGLENLKPKKD